MAKNLTYLFILSAFFTHAQPNFDFFTSINAVCTNDLTVITLPEFWDIYQTENDKWDGPVDSTFCIGITNFNRIQLEQIDPNRALFIRYQFTDANKVPLEPHATYRFASTSYINNSNIIDYGIECENDLCTGIILGVEIPDSSGTGNAMRYHTTSYDPDVYSNNFVDMCMATEEFEVQHMREFILKFKFNEEDLNNDYIQLLITYCDPTWFGISFLENPVVPASTFDGNNSYEIFLRDIMPNIGWNQHVIVPHYEEGYPSPDNISYHDFELEENTEESRTINLTINYGEDLFLLPFTSLRGGGTEAAGTHYRHNLNLINNGGNMCFESIDLEFGSDESYIHKGGTVNFSDDWACMQFKEGGKLVVADGVDFTYGTRGKGVLALRQGGTIEIGENASLTIDSRMYMNESRYDLGPQDLYMELNTGSKLSFTKRAQLSNEGSIDSEMKLNILMKGGELDLSELSDHERSLINVVFSTPEEFDNSIKAYPNPVRETLSLKIQSEKEQSAQVQIFDPSGKLLFNSSPVLSDGQKNIQFSISEIPNGYYIGSVTIDGESRTFKFIKLKEG